MSDPFHSTLDDMREYVDGDYPVPRHVLARWVRALEERGPAPTAADALRWGAAIVGLYDDAMSHADYMLDAGECGDILVALADYVAPAGVSGTTE